MVQVNTSGEICRCTTSVYLFPLFCVPLPVSLVMRFLQIIFSVSVLNFQIMNYIIIVKRRKEIQALPLLVTSPPFLLLVILNVTCRLMGTGHHTMIINLKCATIVAKSGIEPANCVELVKHVKSSCPNLVFSGLMTIGMPDYTSTPENFRVNFLPLLFTVCN